MLTVIKTCWNSHYVEELVVGQIEMVCNPNFMNNAANPEYIDLVMNSANQLI